MTEIRILPSVDEESLLDLADYELIVQVPRELSVADHLKISNELQDAIAKKKRVLLAPHIALIMRPRPLTIESQQGAATVPSLP
jgi:hypothetical protein